jgi:hypothetical protein
MITGLEPPHHVEVEVENDLAAFFADVELEAVAFALVAFGELFADENEVSYEVFVFFFQVFDTRDRFTRDDEEMNGGFRINVFDRDAFFIFKDKFCRDFPIDDFLKKGFLGSHGWTA